MRPRTFPTALLMGSMLCLGSLPAGCHDHHEEDEEEDAMVDVDVPEEGPVRVRAPYVNVEVDRPPRRHRAKFDPVPVTIDHATIACRDLDATRAAFDAAGLTTAYGGEHTGGTTHMAIVAFPDGSYLELVAPVDRAARNFAFWRAHLLRGAGPCGWAARSGDVSADAARLLDAGVAVEGPIDGGRKRPDGTELQWRIIIAGGGAPGAVLPFLIEDLSDRSLRVGLPPGEASLQGLAWVVVGVDDLNDAVADFQQAYGWPDPVAQDDAAFGARLVHFPGTPVVLAWPLREDNWLDDRIDELGDGPVAYLLATAELGVAVERYALRNGGSWFGRGIAWFNAAQLGGTRLGVLETAVQEE